MRLKTETAAVPRCCLHFLFEESCQTICDICTKTGTTLIRTPAATALPMTPDTFGPMACMSRKFWGSAS